MNNENRTNNLGCKPSKEHLKGIKCEVKNCVYHDCDTYCTAHQIAVGNAPAANAACDTFKEKK